jgi:hypothetical protein
VSRLIGVIIVIGSATAVAGPSGRVVRVERVSGGSQIAPRLCEIRGDTGTCVGEQPRAGQMVLVIDDSHVVAEVEVIEVASFVARCANLWTVKTRARRGAAADAEGIGVIDASIDPSRARVIDKTHTPPSPSGDGDEVWRAIDRDGDGTADVLFTRYPCDRAGTPVTGAAAYCIDIWSRGGARMTRTAQLNFSQCTP